MLLDADLASESRFFNLSSTATYNATTVATVAGAMLFIALNTIFIMLFVGPKTKAGQKEGSSSNSDYDDEYYPDESEDNFYDDEVRKRKR